MPAPLLVGWGARSLYVGPSLQLDAHRNAVAVLAIALDGWLELARVPEQPALGFVRCRTALIEPATLHLLKSTGRHCAFLYLDAASSDLHVIRNACRERTERACFHLEAEAELIALLGALAHRGWNATRAALSAVLKFERARPDRRIRLAIETIAGAPGQTTPVAALALAAGLSASRFQHLFKHETGVPYRRFRLWMRLRSALIAAQGGAALTTAAHGAGFSSSAHLSTAFKAMFGISPSQLLALQPLLINDPGGESDARRAGGH